MLLLILEVLSIMAVVILPMRLRAKLQDIFLWAQIT